ncbi:MAG: hypothetical protein BWY76_01781 [bacterium ADurb.Bin429]|nr:MAG: hypothetical protein BWY76_01781 [bacterium ADurb.Bin429]
MLKRIDDVETDLLFQRVHAANVGKGDAWAVERAHAGRGFVFEIHHRQRDGRLRVQLRFKILIFQGAIQRYRFFVELQRFFRISPGGGSAGKGEQRLGALWRIQQRRRMQRNLVPAAGFRQ